MQQFSSLVVVSLSLLGSNHHRCYGFIFQSSSQSPAVPVGIITTTTTTSHYHHPSSSSVVALFSTVHHKNDDPSTTTTATTTPDFVEIREDIQRMKEEAAQRLDVLSERFKEVETMRSSSRSSRSASQGEAVPATATEKATTVETDLEEPSPSSVDVDVDVDVTAADADANTSSLSTSSKSKSKLEQSLTDKADEFDHDMKEFFASSSLLWSTSKTKKVETTPASSKSTSSSSSSPSPSSSSTSTTQKRTSVADLYPKQHQQKQHSIKPNAPEAAVVESASTSPTTTMEKEMEMDDQKLQQHHPLKLLDDTRWRMMFNVGRVPGTWMPKTWGASGETMNLKLELEFTSEELYEREDFFHSQSDGTKIVKVVHNKAYMSPKSLTEGEKAIRVTDGGWKIMEHDGPLGTSVLRFYFNVEEEARHLGSDVYLPQGRVYGTCGYFPMMTRSSSSSPAVSSSLSVSTTGGGGLSKREVYENELKQLEVRYQNFKTERDNLSHNNNYEDRHTTDTIKNSNSNEYDDAADDADSSNSSLLKWSIASLPIMQTPFIRKLTLTKKMLDLQEEAIFIQKLIEEQRVKEPSKDTLRLSQDQLVGLTKEGGICCKKTKGLSQEYRILGKFTAASMQNRDHSNYNDVLRP